MNLNKLFGKQKELDDYIGKSKDVNMEDHKLDRVEALSVEYHELLNEIRFFKYWSNKTMDREKALVEYVDTLHFLLSIGNDLKIPKYKYEEPKVMDMRKLRLGIINMISRLANLTYTDFFKEKEWAEYRELLNHFLLLGEKLRFTEEEVLESYELKHEVNYARQENGY